MRFPSQLGILLSGAAVLILLEACSGNPTASAGGGAIPEQTHTSVLSPIGQRAVTGAHFFVSDNGNHVYIFSKAGKLLTTVTCCQEAVGVAIDKSGSLYVADLQDHDVQVYAKGYTGKPTTLSEPGQDANGVAIDAHGDVAVTNLFTTSNGPGSVSFYAKGATVPSKTLVSPTFSRMNWGAFDANGNFYLDGSDSTGHTLVGIVIGGINGKKIKTLTTGNDISFPGSVQVTTKGLIAIDDPAAGAIYTYNPPKLKTGSLGNPVSTTLVTGLAGNGGTFVFTPQNAALYTVDYHNHTANKYAYPAGGSPVRNLQLPLEPESIAVYPAEFPQARR